MGLLRSLAMLAVILWLFGSTRLSAQNVVSNLDSAKSLDALLQDYAYRAFVHRKTGIPYDEMVPSNLTGIEISAMRLRSGSLRRRGVKMYKEFEIPTGIIVHPYVVRLVLVYQNLGNWSTVYYPLPGYRFLAPVLGLLAYDASNLSATNLPELGIEVSGNPIVINFTRFMPTPLGSAPKCVRFSLDGSVNLSSLVSDNLCMTTQQGHFSVVVESIAPSPSPTPPLPSGGGQPPSAVVPPPPSAVSKKSSKVWKITGSVVGGLALLLFLVVLVLWGRKHKQRMDIQRMERAADAGEALHIASVGDTRAPAAMVTRTQPMLEHEYVP